MNKLDNPEFRRVAAARNAHDFVIGAQYATTMTLMLLPDEVNVAAAIDNCTMASISATIIYLQERGCVIPADILSELKIEG